MDGSTQEQFERLLRFLQEKSIVVDDSARIMDEERIVYSRVFSMLEDYASSEDEVQRAWQSIKTSAVLIVGLGAVGSWIAATLAQSGVKKMILMDHDQVELSNLHRQWGYTVNDVGKQKTTALRYRLLEMDPQMEITCIDSFLEKNNLQNIIRSCIHKRLSKVWI